MERGFPSVWRGHCCAYRPPPDGVTATGLAIWPQLLWGSNNASPSAVQTGIKCNAHSFRRGLATELRRKALSELDIADLVRWSSVEMVMRYSRAYTFDDVAERYKPVVT